MRVGALPDDDHDVSIAFQAGARNKKTGHAAGFFVCSDGSAFFGEGQFRIDQPLLSRCAFDSRFISGSTATAIMVQTSAAMPSLLNRLV